MNSGSVFGCVDWKLSVNLKWGRPLLTGDAHLKTVIIDTCYYDKLFVNLKWDCSLIVGDADFKNVTIDACRWSCDKLFVHLKWDCPLHTGGAHLKFELFSVSKEVYCAGNCEVCNIKERTWFKSCSYIQLCC